MISFIDEYATAIIAGAVTVIALLGAKLYECQQRLGAAELVLGVLRVARHEVGACHAARQRRRPARNAQDADEQRQRAQSEARERDQARAVRPERPPHRRLVPKKDDEREAHAGRHPADAVDDARKVHRRVARSTLKMDDTIVKQTKKLTAAVLTIITKRDIDSHRRSVLVERVPRAY